MVTMASVDDSIYNMPKSSYNGLLYNIHDDGCNLRVLFSMVPL
jgi:hypothetical protein